MSFPLAAVSRSSAKLVLIDMQQIFQAPESQWFVSNYSQAESKLEQLRGHFPQAIWTRFVRDPEEHGAWKNYYERWDQCRAETDSERWDLTLEPNAQDDVLSLPTFSKWGTQLSELTAGNDHLVVAGVATDCCVLSTVLGAVDAGKQITVVSDACGGATPEAHQQALDLMNLLSPMVQIVTADQLSEMLEP